MPSPIDTALTALRDDLRPDAEPAHVRAVLEALLADEAELDAATIATIWGSSERAARERLRRLHAERGLGRQVGGVWLMRRADVLANPPDPRFRRAPVPPGTGKVR